MFSTPSGLMEKKLKILIKSAKEIEVIEYSPATEKSEKTDGKKK